MDKQTKRINGATIKFVNKTYEALSVLKTHRDDIRYFNYDHNDELIDEVLISCSGQSGLAVRLTCTPGGSSVCSMRFAPVAWPSCLSTKGAYEWWLRHAPNRQLVRRPGMGGVVVSW